MKAKLHEREKSMISVSYIRGEKWMYWNRLSQNRVDYNSSIYNIKLNMNLIEYDRNKIVLTTLIP